MKTKNKTIFLSIAISLAVLTTGTAFGKEATRKLANSSEDCKNAAIRVAVPVSEHYSVRDAHPDEDSPNTWIIERNVTATGRVLGCAAFAVKTKPSPTGVGCTAFKPQELGPCLGVTVTPTTPAGDCGASTLSCALGKNPICCPMGVGIVKAGGEMPPLSHRWFCLSDVQGCPLAE